MREFYINLFPIFIILIIVFGCSRVEGYNYLSNLNPPEVRPGIDPFSWNGAVFIGDGEAIFGIRVGLIVDGKYITGKDVYDSVKEVGPRSPDGSYARITYGKNGKNLVLSWSVVDKGVIVGSVSPLKDSTEFVIESYFPWEYPGKYSIDEISIYGEAKGVLTEEESWSSGEIKETYFRLVPSLKPKKYGSFASISEMLSEIEGGRGEEGNRAAYLRYMLDSGEVLVFKAAIAPKPLPVWTNMKRDEILRLIEKAGEEYERRRFKGTGGVGKVARAIMNEEGWMFSYQPNHNTEARYPRTFVPAGRIWVWGDWTTFCWDPMFQSAILSMENEVGAYNTVISTFASQREDGMIPNYWSGNVWKESEGSSDRSQPPVASYFIWKLYRKFHNREFLKTSYGALARWYNWWLSEGVDGLPNRDGNRDALLEWGSTTGETPRQPNHFESRWAAAAESGLDDSPMWDDVEMEGIHMRLNSIWLSSLRALDAEMMARIAEELGKDEDRDRYLRDYEEIKELINERLWNEEVGMYLSRHWNGQWEYDEGIPTITPANFTPLIAGVATEEKAERMIKEHLLNTNEFWGKYVIPTINKNHPDYKVPYTYWRGTIWPPTNYLVYEGLKRYGYDSVAAVLAQKSTDLWLGPWEESNWACENYNPETGRRSSLSHKHQGWSMNLPLTGIQELIDVEPWSEKKGTFRFGTLGLEGTNKLQNVWMQGYLYDIKAGPDSTVLYRDGRRIFKGINDRFIVREFMEEAGKLSFNIKCMRPIRIVLYPPLTQSRVRGNVPSGINRVEVVGEKLTIK